MNLAETNQQLQTTIQQLLALFPAMQQLEYAYQKRYFRLVLDSQRPSQQLREAEAQAILMEEEIYEKYHNLKVDIKALYNKKDFLIEYGKNLRALLANRDNS